MRIEITNLQQVLQLYLLSNSNQWFGITNNNNNNNTVLLIYEIQRYIE